jgi:hypothetical protein
LKLPVASLRCFKRGGSQCKMRSADLPEPEATREQNLYTCRSSAPYLSSVTLIYAYARRVSVKITRGVHVLQYNHRKKKQDKFIYNCKLESQHLLTYIQYFCGFWYAWFTEEYVFYSFSRNRLTIQIDFFETRRRIGVLLHIPTNCTKSRTFYSLPHLSEKSQN